MEDTQLSELSTLLKNKASSDYDIVKTNFKIGQIVNDVRAADGDEGVSKLAVRSGTSQYFLYTASNVACALNMPLISSLRQKFGGKLSWWFLVNNCSAICF
ncbi:MAG: hypothetical protein ACLP29_00685 [Dissulfurispiraceae bacterium]